MFYFLVSLIPKSLYIVVALKGMYLKIFKCLVREGVKRWYEKKVCRNVLPLQQENKTMWRACLILFTKINVWFIRYAIFVRSKTIQEINHLICFERTAIIRQITHATECLSVFVNAPGVVVAPLLERWPLALHLWSPWFDTRFRSPWRRFSHDFS